MSITLRAAACVGLLAFMAGCRATPTAIAEGQAYPGTPQTRVLDVQVFRDETRIRLTNTSAHTFGPCRMWLNQWYSRELDGLAAAETATLNLGEFRDRYGASFRAGGFFATERPDRLVLAQIEENNEIVGLVVVGGTVE